MNEMTPPKKAEAAPAHITKPVTEMASPHHSHSDQASKIWRFLSMALPNTSGILFRHKMTSLRVASLMRATETGEIDDGKIQAQIDHLKNDMANYPGGRDWSAAGEIEQLQICQMDMPTMRVEMRRYLADARRTGLNNLSEYEEMAKEAEAEPGAYRIVLVRLAADVQQRFRKRHIYREYVAAYTARVSFLFFLSAVTFVGLLFLLTFAESDAQSRLEALGPIGEGAPPHIQGWLRSMGPVALALAAGLFGSAFSMMSQTRKRIEVSTLEDMRTNARMVMLLFRLCVGVGAAMIVYYVFDSQFLGDSSNFPEPQKARIGVSYVGDNPFDVVGVLTANTELSQLIVWSFVAGFSELLVPSILRKAESAVARDEMAKI